MKILSCLLVYFSAFHININQQIGCLNNANHIHFTCTLYCAPELSIITNILRKKWNLKSTKELFCYLKTMWLFSRQATMLQPCMLPVWILQGFSLRCHCDLLGRGGVRKKTQKIHMVFAHVATVRTLTKKLENIWNINVLLLYNLNIYSNLHCKQLHCNGI